MKILYIEDNPADIDLTLRKFKKLAPHIDMETAKGQFDALKLIKDPKSDYDLVLTDMHLQDGDGIAILSHIRGHSIPVAVVLLTGQGNEQSAVAALKAGADDYIVKKSGYLDKLPKLLEDAVVSYREEKRVGIQSLNVLYIEHNHADVDLTRRHFARYAPHIQLETVGRVSDFFEMVRQADALSQYSALLLDYRLPQENALEILTRISISPNAGIPVVLVTGKGDEEIAVNALKMGAFDYVTKNQGYLFKLPSIIENAHYSTRLRREHEALIESEERYRSLFENNHVVMLLLDPDNGNIIDANSAASNFYGWSEKELRAKNIYKINTLSSEDLEKEIQAVLREKQGHYFYQHMLADGSICDVEVFSGPIEFEGRSLILSMIYDITQRLKIQQEKDQLQKQLTQARKMESFGQLAGGIAHDFNNILSSIIGFTELALDKVQQESAIEEDLNEVYAAGQRAADLVRQILAFARQSDEEIKPLEISPIAKEVLKLIRSSTPANIEIRQTFDTDAYIMGNAIQIHQVMMNLCTNAVCAMEDEGGLLQISLNDRVVDGDHSITGLDLSFGSYIELTISDTGTGIAPEIMESIFEPYFTTKGPGKGTGMGLALVHGIVESYYGKILVDSVLGKGTTVTIYFPTTKKRKAHRIHDSETLPSGTENILLVDDEAAIAKIGSLILDRLGYTVTTRTSSMEALELFRSKPNAFDLVITDMTMPNMTGDKLTLELMKIKPDIDVILCTGYSNKITEKSAAAIGIKAFAYKPFVGSALAKTVRKVLDRSRQKVYT